MTLPKFTLRRERLNSQGYDRTGCYWGVGQPLFWFSDHAHVSENMRAPDRKEAKRRLQVKYPGATFYR